MTALRIGDDRLPPRFWSKVRRDARTGCWVWTGAVSSSGYGSFRWDGRNQGPHCVAWSELVGPIPAGLVTDHVVCERKLCVNPAHLVVCTHAENLEREMPKAWAGHTSRTHCPNGHAYEEAGIIWEPRPTARGGQQVRKCRQCNKDRCRSYRQRVKQRVRVGGTVRK